MRLLIFGCLLMIGVSAQSFIPVRVTQLSIPDDHKIIFGPSLQDDPECQEVEVFSVLKSWDLEQFSKGYLPIMNLSWVNQDLMHVQITLEQENPWDPWSTLAREEGNPHLGIPLNPAEPLEYAIVPLKEEEFLPPQNFINPMNVTLRGRQLGFCDSKWNGWYCDGSTLKECYWSNKRSEFRCSHGCRRSGSSSTCLCGNVCYHGGRFDRFCTVCTCPSPWIGPYCQQCGLSFSHCGNGGHLDSLLCACNCGTPCQHGGSQSSTCHCSCPEPWTGNHCEICSRTDSYCVNEGTIDSTSCTCQCPHSCQNGGTRGDNCACTCPFPYSGAFCEVCTLEASHCENGATFDQTNCRCDCSTGDSCLNGGTLKSDRSCGCDCSAPWGGDHCQTCQRDDSFCYNQGKMNADTCQCNCAESLECLHGGRIDSTNPDGARCGCTECDGNWEGVRCEVCDLQCHHGKQVNGTICECFCPEGEDCSSGLSGGAIAGIVIGAVVAVGIICYLIKYYLCGRGTNYGTQASQSTSSPTTHKHDTGSSPATTEERPPTKYTYP